MCQFFYISYIWYIWISIISVIFGMCKCKSFITDLYMINVYVPYISLIFDFSFPFFVFMNQLYMIFFIPVLFLISVLFDIYGFMFNIRYM